MNQAFTIRSLMYYLFNLIHIHISFNSLAKKLIDKLFVTSKI